MTSVYEIHSVFVLHERVPVEIPISRKYKSVVGDKGLHISPAPGPDAVFEQEKLASFTCLFGKNGCGKTELLVDLAGTFAEHSNDKKLGVLFSVDGVLCLHRGKALAKIGIAQEGLQAELRVPPPAPVVFYTTSPYESERRRTLNRMGVADMTPSLATERGFEGLSLILNCDAIHDIDADIARKLKVTVRGRISRERTERLLAHLLDRFAATEDEDESVFLQRARSRMFDWLAALEVARRYELQADLALLSHESNKNLAGSFVGSLMRLTQNFYLDPDPDRALQLADLARKAVLGGAYLKLAGREVLQGLHILKTALAPKRQGPGFTIAAPPGRLRDVLVAVDQAHAGLARFLARFEFIDFKLARLSSGETAFMYLFGALGAALDKLAADGVEGPVWLMLDEGEMFMHPAWQRSYIRNVLDFIGLFQKRGLGVHLMISTHSLIVAADAPPRSLFNVESGKRMNGFGLGPRATLEDLYGVEKFTGTNATRLMDELTEFLRDARAQPTPRIVQLKNALADLELKRYVDAAIDSRG